MSYTTEGLRDVAAERGVLASVFYHGSDAYADVADLCSASSFDIGSNKILWSVATKILEENPNAKPDFSLILSTAKSLGHDLFEKEGELVHLRAILNAGEKSKLSSVRLMAKRLKKLEIARLGLEKLKEGMDRLSAVTGDESVDAIINMIEQPIFDFSTSLETTSSGPQAVGSGVRDYLDFLAKNQRDQIGISTGFPTYDRAIGGGLRPGTVNMIGARPKTGKTIFGMNVGMYIAGTLGVPVLYLDTEMTLQDQWHRMVAHVSKVKIDDIETGKYAARDASRHAVADAVDKLEKMPYKFASIAGQPFEETVAMIRRWLAKEVGLNDDGTAKPCVVIFDYLKLMSSDSMESSNLAEFQVLGFMMTQMHNLTVRFKFPVLSFIQLNRDGIDREDTDVASGSDRIIWLCSNFSIFKKQSDDELAQQVGNKQVYNRKLVPIVARHGAGLEGGDFINMMSHGAVATIVEGPTRDEMGRNGGNVQGEGMIVGDTRDQAEASL